MTEELVLYTNPQSRGRIARWMLEEIGQPYRVVLLDYGTTMKAPDYLAINPMGKVPAVVHRGAIVTESAAICTYLADAFPAAGLAPPPGTAERASYYRWMFFAAGPLEAAITDRAMAVEVPPGSDRMVGYGTLARTLDVLETAVRDRPFIAGDRFSAADVYVGSHIAFGLRFGSIDRRAAFVGYAARLAERPAAIRANAADDALMPPA